MKNPTQTTRMGVDLMRCGDCKRELEVGDLYIKDTASGFIKQDTTPEIDGLIAEIFGGSGGKIVFCEDCTQEGGDYLFETVYGDEEDAS
jgi:hypothetical protein